MSSLAAAEAPKDATHQAEFYGRVDYYRLTHGLHFNTVIDHPTECWQKTDIWHVWEKGRWICVGSGWSSRRLRLIERTEDAH